MRTQMYLERQFDWPIGPAEVVAMAAEGAGCFGIHKIAWHFSLLSNDGRKMFCSFSAPDMESARIAMRQSDIDIRVFWRGNSHDAPQISEQDLLSANVLVERKFDEPVELERIQAIEDAGVGCLQSRHVRFVRTIFSADRKRMICLYSAPDAESVRQAQREAGVPFEEAWAFRMIRPSDAAGSRP